MENKPQKQKILRAKGVKDIVPEQKIAMQKITDVMRQVFEVYGYSPLETPTLERSELYDVKFGQGEKSDVIQESFRLTDRADRKLILRNEMTTPLAIFVADNPNIKMPFKRYEMGKVFRDGPIKAGRYREFWQCDIDVVGVKDVSVDAEMIGIALDIFKRLDIPVELKVNTRVLLNEILSLAGITDENQIKQVLIIMDKFDDVGVAGVKKELVAKDIESDAVDKIIDLISVVGTNQEKISQLEEKIPNSQGLVEIKKILELVDNQDVVFVPSLMRGQAYYTGPIYEVYAQDKKVISSSIAGGGRYDKMIGDYLGGSKEYPATGVSFGLYAIYDYLLDQDNSAYTGQKTVVQVFIVPMGEDSFAPAWEVLNTLRENNIPADIDLMQRNVRKNLDYVNVMAIPYCLIIGEDEIKENSVMLKNMQSGEQEKVKIDKLVEKLKEVL